MIRYSDELLDEIKVKNDIVDVISGYVALKRSGRSYFGICPFHNEKSPSFAVSPDKQIFHCFGCGVGGNVFHFVSKIEGVGFREAVDASKKYKEDYVNGINALIEARERDAESNRFKFCKSIFLNQEKYREDFKTMLGWPLTEACPENIPLAKIEKLSDDVNCSIYRIFSDFTWKLKKVRN